MSDLDGGYEKDVVRQGRIAGGEKTGLICRLRGRWPTWCVGARRLPPFVGLFAAQAVVEAVTR